MAEAERAIDRQLASKKLRLVPLEHGAELEVAAGTS